MFLLFLLSNFFIFLIKLLNNIILSSIVIIVSIKKYDLINSSKPNLPKHIQSTNHLLELVMIFPTKKEVRI